MRYIDKLYKVLNLLEDDKSKDIFDKRIDFLINRNEERIREIVELSCPETLPLREDVFNQVFESVDRSKGVILYGAGEWSRTVENHWRKAFGDDIICFVDSDTAKQGFHRSGIEICAPEIIKQYPGCSVVILVLKGISEIKETIHEMGVEYYRIHHIPAAGEISKRQYFEEGIISFVDGEEVFLDVGCCDLETTIILKEHCTTKRVYAFEPDPENYKRCKMIIRDYKFGDVELLPYGAWDCDGSIDFILSGNSCSRYAVGGETGNSHIETRKIDSLIPNEEKVTFIKMDIEGAEYQALCGAKETIKRCKPKLAISIYHSANDMAEIPLYIKALNPDYKLYVRHYSNEHTETVLYAV